MNKIRTTCEIVVMILCMVLTPVGASDFKLKVFGNANMDDTIDELDIKYVQGIIEGTNEVTELADANYNGEVDEDDISQIEQIIGGVEKKLTIMDSADRIVTIDKPVERVASLNAMFYVARVLNAEDKIVGIPAYLLDDFFAAYPSSLFPELQDMAIVGGVWTDPYYENIIDLDPDVLIMFHYKLLEGVSPDEMQEILEPVGAKVIGLDFTKVDTFYEEVATLGYILDTEERADDYINFFQSWTDRVDDVVDDLDPEEKKTVYFEGGEKYSSYGGPSSVAGMVRSAGGNHIYDDISLDNFEVDPEDLAERNPDVIFALTWTGRRGYLLTNTSEFEDIRDELMNRPELSWVTAVENADVYVIGGHVCIGFTRIIGPVFLAKCLYPDKFEDLEPHDYLKEYMEDWLRIPYQGEYLYPYPPE